MCFSAAASFTTAALTGAVGIVCLARARDPLQWPLAAIPLFFALQQGMEGALWLTLPVAEDASISTGLTLLYLLFAQTFWPVYAPIAAACTEPDDRRRRLMLVCAGLGGAISIYLLWGIIARSHGAGIVAGHIVYVSETPIPFALGFAYLAATALPLLLSSHKVVVWLGAVVLVGCVTANLFYWAAFASVWCFFAAVASAMLLFHFEQARQRLNPALPDEA